MILSPELAVQARAKMEHIIEAGQRKALNGMESIINEYGIRKDSLVPAAEIKYHHIINKERLTIGAKVVQTTTHSLSQLLERIKMPKTFYNALQGNKEDWAVNLLQENLRVLTDGNLKENKLLFRTVGKGDESVVKGILSNEYRRMDATPIFKTFIETGMEEGLVPSDGLNTNTRYHIKMLDKEIYEPIKGEIIGFGLSITTSDYGVGALTIQMNIMRVFCTNLAIGDNMLRQIHLGKRFGEDELVLSQATYDLDTKAIASAVRDIIRIHFKDKVVQYLKRIADSDGQEINVDSILKNLQEKGIMNKGQLDTAKALYRNVDDIEVLPQQEGAWRMSNVISLMANDKKIDGDTSLRFQEAAYGILKAA